ncbi:MAG: YeeE/YedE family protein [Halieaceae bacterium]|jgi:uncharacterized membrane protein YedE/YeeE|nr:YeeE/YedE family protein [Halieaceae bacterium]
MESELSTWMYELGTSRTSLIIGLFIGLLFGVFAQQSRFCLRAACVEFWRGEPGGKFAIWLLTFGAALLLTQLFVETQLIETGGIRQLNNAGSLSGAIVGGLLFGSGMVLARGCASRLLILSATGNVRALVAGLMVTVVAQASLRGGLGPLREEISSWWLVEGHLRSLARLLPAFGGVVMGGIFLVLAVYFVRRFHVNLWWSIAAMLTGGTVSLAWLVNSQHAANSFDIVPVQSISFTGPAADTLMGLINEPSLPPSFDIGLVPGVFIGSMLASLLSRQFKWQAFTEETGTSRYLIGATMMGFGAMLAGGCAVGAGISGGSLLLGTAWIALFCMWLSAGATDWLVDRAGYLKILGRH